MIKFNIYSILKILGILILIVGIIFCEILSYETFILQKYNIKPDEENKSLGIVIFCLINIMILLVICAYIDINHKYIFTSLNNFCKKERVIKFK